MNSLNSFSYSDMTAAETKIQRVKIKAYCTSYMCEKDYKSKKTGVLKNVPITKTFCDDCGAALFWVKDGDKRVAEKETNRV